MEQEFTESLKGELSKVIEPEFVAAQTPAATVPDQDDTFGEVFF